MMEAVGFVGAVIGLIAAIINPRRIIEIRHVTHSTHGPGARSPAKAPVGIRKRFKRLGVCMALAFLCAMIGGNSGADDAMMFPFAICFLAGAYQCLAIFFLFLARLWR